MTVGVDRAVVETALRAGGLRCPAPGCGQRLAPWGSARERGVRGAGRLTPRRVTCGRGEGWSFRAEFGDHFGGPAVLPVRRE